MCARRASLCRKFGAVPPPKELDVEVGLQSGRVAGADGLETATVAAKPSDVDTSSVFKPMQQHQEFRPPLLDLPMGKQLPSSLKEYLIIERTAQFVREIGENALIRLRMECLARLPFLRNSHPLYWLYSHLRNTGMNLLSVQPEIIPEKIQAMLRFVYPHAGKQTRPSRVEDPPKQLPVLQGTLLEQLQHTQAESCKAIIVAEEPQQKSGMWELLLSYGSDEEADESEGGGNARDNAPPNDSLSAKDAHGESTSQSPTTQVSSSASEKDAQIRFEEQASSVHSESDSGTVEGMPSSVLLSGEGGIQLVGSDNTGLDASCADLALSNHAKLDSGSKESSDFQVGHRNFLGPEYLDIDLQDSAGVSPKDSACEPKETPVGRYTKEGTKKVRIDIAARRSDTASPHPDKPQPSSGGPKTEDEIKEALEKLPKASWAAPSAKLNISPASSLAIQQIGFQLLAFRDVDLVKKAAQYNDDSSMFPFLRTSSMDLRYFRYVLRCVEGALELEKSKSFKPFEQPLHDHAREFLARLQLDVHLQKRKCQLLQQCMRLETTEHAAYNQALPVVDSACLKTGASAQVSGVSHDAALTLAQDSPRMDTPVSEDLGITSGVKSVETATPVNAVECGGTVSLAVDSGCSLQHLQHQLEQLVYHMKVASDAQDMVSYMANYNAYCQLAAFYSAAAAHPARITESNIGTASAATAVSSTLYDGAQETGAKPASE